MGISVENESFQKSYPFLSRYLKWINDCNERTFILYPLIHTVIIKVLIIINNIRERGLPKTS